ncbi:MAG: tetratricopeptide (TPR) repeat protein [Pirellulaceae bacterium]|jgi:tetratricopeptide (TPR) repeat protein
MATGESTPASEENPADNSDYARSSRPGRAAFFFRGVLLFGVLAIVFALLRIGSFPDEMARWHMAAAQNHADDKDFKAAEQSLHDAASWDGDNPDIYLIRADWHLANKEFEKALEAFQAAIDAAPNQPHGYVARSNYYEERNELAKTLPDCDQLVRIYEQEGVRQYFSYRDGTMSIRPYNRRAYHRALANEQVAAGIEDANKSMEIFGKSLAVLDTRGYLYFRMGDYEKALKDMDTAIEGQRVWVEDLRGKPKSAQISGNLVLHEHTLAVLLVHRMKVFEAQGEQEKARRDREQIVELSYDPDDEKLH